MVLHRSGRFKVTKKYGYKWFDASSRGALTSPLKHSRENAYRKNCWIINDMHIALPYDRTDEVYYAGFHIFINLKDAKKSNFNRSGWHRELWKVEFDDYIVGYGDGLSNDNAKQIVAQRMKIIEKVEV